VVRVFSSSAHRRLVQSVGYLRESSVHKLITTFCLRESGEFLAW
jgi:hypothetical protein